MPEGHTIHRAARDHQRLLGGQQLVLSSPQGRFAASAEALNGRRLDKVEAWGKHLFYWFDGAGIVHVHLGLFGSFTIHDTAPPPEPVGAVRWRLVGEQAAVDLTGPTECRLGGPDLRDAVVARLGPDPLRPKADRARFVAKVAASKVPIGRLLMDQSVVAGVGNVFRAEALFLAGLHPDVVGRAVGEAQVGALWDLLAKLLRDGVRRNRIVTIPVAAVGKPIGQVRRGEATWIYRRETCRRCEAPIRRWEVGGRWCYACETCQAPPT